MTDTVRVRVLEGWVVYDGVTQRGAEETLDIDPETADRWVTAGWVVNVKTPSKRRRTP